MKNILRILLFAVMLSLGLVPQAMATEIIGQTNYLPNEKLDAVESLTSAYANTTITASDLTGMTYTVPATNSNYSKQFFRVCWNADVTKSTATTGSISVNISGTIDALSTRFSASSAGRNTIGGCYVIQRATASAVTIKLQGVSADTNNFAVTNAQMEIWRVTLGG